MPLKWFRLAHCDGKALPVTRTYNQGCILAYALDCLGERWTLLIVRDLLLGPRGFVELQTSLKGIGGSLLSKRLKELEEVGVITSETPDGKRSHYRLTELGEHLRPTVRSMMRWSVRFMLATVENPQTRQTLFDAVDKPDSVALGVEMYAEFQRDPSLSYVAHLVVDSRPYTVYYMKGEMTVRRGADAPAMAKVEIDSETAYLGLRRKIDSSEIRTRSKIEGAPAVLAHLLKCIASKRPEKHESNAA